MNNHPDPKDEKAMRIAYLIAGFLQQTLTPGEHDELDRWVEASDENMRLFEELTDEENLTAGMQRMQEKDSNPTYQSLKERLPFVKEKKRRILWPYAVAASLVLLAVSLYIFRPQPGPMAETAVVSNVEDDLPPGGNKAVLTLADGRKIILENQRSGALQRDETVTITKPDSGQIAYDAARAPGTVMQYNTLTTPNGGQYRVTLSDGTRVWLNAASSLRFPVVFTGGERVVELSGEAYLEVAHDPSKPFYVRSKGHEIKVLGTRFNVAAYAEEEMLTTTLVEGRIQLSTTGEKTILKPGEQAVVNGGGNIRVLKADLESAIAWKEGMFRFRDATIEEVMKEVGRWYDARVVYAGRVDRHFNAEVSRNLPVSKVLQLFEKTGSVHFQVSDKIIQVKP